MRWLVASVALYPLFLPTRLLSRIVASRRDLPIVEFFHDLCTLVIYEPWQSEVVSSDVSYWTGKSVWWQ